MLQRSINAGYVRAIVPKIAFIKNPLNFMSLLGGLLAAEENLVVV